MQHNMSTSDKTLLDFFSIGGDGYHVDSGAGGGGEGDITYEQLQAIIESLVVENGYYQTAT